jgi:hypothetical protein
MTKQDKGKKAGASTSNVERKHVISLRLTDEEYQSFHQYLTSLDVSRSEFFRMLILNRLDDIPALKPKRPTDYWELLRLFNKSSNNINQIAHKTNIEETIDISVLLNSLKNYEIPNRTKHGRLLFFRRGTRGVQNLYRRTTRLFGHICKSPMDARFKCRNKSRSC